MTNTNTKIEWTDVTWSPVTGCTKVSAGCKNCYAEGVADRFWATQYSPTVVDVDGAKVERPRRFTDVRTHADRLDAPLRWRKPKRVFVNSMSDLFHDAVPNEFIDRVFAVMALAPRHTFQVLTKRPARMRDWRTAPRVKERVADAAMRMLRDSNRAGSVDMVKTWPNVWLGVSCENQDAADERIPLLLQTPAAVRFLSCEPLLGSIDLSSRLRRSTRHHLRASVSGILRNRSFTGLTDDNGRELSRDQAEQRLRSLLNSGVRYIAAEGCDDFDPETGCRGHTDPGIDWVIAGGESGPGARPCDVAWIRSLVEQCKAAGTACFVKQLGRWPVAIRGAGATLRDVVDDERRQGLAWPEGTRFGNPTGDVSLNGRLALLQSAKGGDPAEWPEDLRVREFPQSPNQISEATA